MYTVTYSVPSMRCGHCSNAIESEVGELQGVASVKADNTTKQVNIVFDKPASEGQIKALLAEMNYPVA
ncbi:MAG: heavy-metal-associated domain-containing protein [Deltaproteobacteria bacterium]|nr:heavy-metal-associated domain-containing protein [Deltaproteobacteria bacterium]